MISKTCLYSYYPWSSKETSNRPLANNGIEISFISFNEVKQLFNTRQISNIIGYTDGIVIRENLSLFKQVKINRIRQLHICKYTPDIIDEFFDVDIGIKDIINSYLNFKCKDKEEAKIKLMAKILGA